MKSQTRKTPHQDATGDTVIYITTLPSPLRKHASGAALITTVSACPLPIASTQMAPLPTMLPASVVIPDARRLQDFIATNQKIYVTLAHHAQSLTALLLIWDRVDVGPLDAQQVQDCTATNQKAFVTLAHHAHSLTALLLIWDRADVATLDVTMRWV